MKDIKAALTFGNTLEHEFHRLVSLPGITGEIAYFRALQNAFTGISKNYQIEEYHGSSHQIVFNGSAHRWARRTARCELSDLMILAFRKNPSPSIRLSFIQAKFDKASHAHLGARMPKQISLNANLEQWDLLSRRPRLSPANRSFTPMPDLLSGALLPSVGSFIFLRAPHTSVIPSLTYESADAISITGSPTSKHAKVTTNLTTNFRNVGPFLEMSSTASCRRFGAALHLHLVGTPIHQEPVGTNGNQNPDSIYRSNVRSWLLGVFEQYLLSNNNRPVLNELIYLLRRTAEPPRDKDIVEYNPPKNLILLKTDSSFAG